MPRIIKELKSLSAVAPGQTATLDVPTGQRYHNIKFLYKGNASLATILADIKAIRVKINGKVQRDIVLSELETMLQFNNPIGQNKYGIQDGIIPIFFSEPWRKNVRSEDALAWGTSDKNITSFQIEIDIDAAANNPTLVAVATVDNVALPLVNIMKLRRKRIQVSSTGIRNLSDVDKRKGQILHRIHCFETNAGDIKSAQIKLDGYEVFDVKKVVNKSNLRDNGLNAQDGVFHICFDATQRNEDALIVVNPQTGEEVQDFPFNFDMNAAEPFTMVIETRGNPD